MEEVHCIDCGIGITGLIYVCLDCNQKICDKCGIYYFLDDWFRCKNCTTKCSMTPLESQNRWKQLMGFFDQKKR